jgi:hypothetical protein
VTVLVLLSVTSVISVNRDNFKTCDQSGFCKYVYCSNIFTLMLDSTSLQNKNCVVDPQHFNKCTVFENAFFTCNIGNTVCHLNVRNECSIYIDFTRILKCVDFLTSNEK